MRWVENQSQTETEEGDEDRTGEDDRTEGICTLSEPSGRKSMLAEFKIQGVCLTMEIDTGAAVTLISLVTFNRHFPKMTLSPSSARLSTYTGSFWIPHAPGRWYPNGWFLLRTTWRAKEYQYVVRTVILISILWPKWK